MTVLRFLAPLLVASAIGGCSESQSPVPLPGDLTATPVASGLSSPVYLTAPTGDARLFVVEQSGRIRVIRNGQLLPTAYLNIASKIVFQGERGLLGLAFHPSFATNGYFYVNYVNTSNNTIIERYQATPSSDVADANSASLVLVVPQPSFTNHKGGMLAFGPDGMLWIGTGDGGSGGDPQNNGQTLTTLLGKMLRIDVNVAGAAYGIPANNPFASSATNRREIWGWGLRNPWRFSFDRDNGTLYVADVGQGAWEEITVVPHTQASVNYGWRLMEGTHCFNPTTCSQTGLTLPVHEYDHSNGNCSVTGGYVYRGNAIPGIRGQYFYSDYCTGFLRSFRIENGSAVDHMTWDVGALGNVTSFGEDPSGELYIVGGNTVFRLSPSS
jgi:glucose/arabinose dehydrogenase